MVSTQKMQEYLKIAVKIESQLYALQISKAQILSEIQKLNSTKYYDDMDCALNEMTYNQGTVKEYIKENYRGLFKTLFKLDLFGSKVISILAMLFMLGTLPQMAAIGFALAFVFIPSGSKGSVLAIGGVLSLVILAIILRLLELVYKAFAVSRLKKEFNSNRFHHNKLMTQSEALYNKNSLLLKGFNIQLDAVNKELRETNTLRNQFYAENILPDKYRNFVAVATMYPWLEYGICTEIYGHGGLFDTYETDLRFKIIIGELKDLNTKADIAIQNQRILINEVRRCNEIAGNILTYVKNIDSTQQRIANDVADIKVSSSISAMAASRTAMYAEYQYYKNN